MDTKATLILIDSHIENATSLLNEQPEKYTYVVEVLTEIRETLKTDLEYESTLEDIQNEIKAWVKPPKEKNAYNIGDQVRFPDIRDPVYESLIDVNMQSPKDKPKAWKIIK